MSWICGYGDGGDECDHPADLAPFRKHPEQAHLVQQGQGSASSSDSRGLGHRLQGAGRLHVLSECIYALLLAKILRLGEEVSLLGASTERRLATARLEAVRLEDALEGLGGRALAGAAATTSRVSTNGGRGHGGRHFVLRVRQTFRMNAKKKKWSLYLLDFLLGFCLPASLGSMDVS